MPAVYQPAYFHTTMSVRLKISIVWLWVAALLSATVGISVHQIYCYCVGETTYSIFKEAGDACAAGEMILPVKDCCSKDQPSCCSKDEGQEQDHHDCTKKSVKVFQLKTEYLVVQPLEKTFDFPVWADEFPEYLRLYRSVVCDATIKNKAPPAPPPPLSGRAICLRHELFRC